MKKAAITKLRLVTSHKPETDFYTFANPPTGYQRYEWTAIRLYGSALAPAGMPEGSMACVAKGAPIKSGDLVAVKVAGSFMVRYVYFGPGGWIRLQSADRDNYKDLIYCPREFEILGLVIHTEARTSQPRD